MDRKTALAFEYFEKTCRAMADPAFYPHPVSRLERRDTHISVVFLTGKWVYKLKKPVDFGFLDFRALESRKRFCEQEVALNARLSHGVYDGVTAICEDSAGGFNIRGNGRAVEYAVRMRQLPEAASLESFALDGRIDDSLLADLGRLLADFYAQSLRGPDIDHYGALETIAFNVEENFRQIEPFIDELSARDKWELVRQVGDAFLRIHRDLFEGRVAEGRIRDCHGDLRAEHVYFDQGIQVIDCIEFNDRFRYGDVILDLAFLHMDLERLGRPDWSRAVLAAYVERASDPELYTLLDFYAAYRAMVRAKVACLRLTEVSEEDAKPLRREASKHLEMAYRCAVRFSRPTLWVFCGLPASGKSTLAREIATALKTPLFQSDIVRKEGAPPRPSVPSAVASYGQGLYRKELRHRVYARMLALAHDELKSGRSVALDATFGLRKWREECRRLAEDCDANIVFVACEADEGVIRERLKARETAPGESDARLEHLPKIMAAFEPFDEIPAGMLVRADAARPLPRVVSRTLSEGYAKRCAQVERLLG
ncbi:MAG: AAA family ATPase [Syntrophobacteraceae bacterium]